MSKKLSLDEIFWNRQWVSCPSCYFIFYFISRISINIVTEHYTWCTPSLNVHVPSWTIIPSCIDDAFLNFQVRLPWRPLWGAVKWMANQVDRGRRVDDRFLRPCDRWESINRLIGIRIGIVSFSWGRYIATWNTRPWLGLNAGWIFYLECYGLRVQCDIIHNGIAIWKKTSWYDDVIKWKHFPLHWPSPHKGQWRGALMFALFCAWINGWVNNREADDLRRHRAHYDVTVMT